MSIAGIIFDVSNTLLQKDGKAAPGIVEAVDRLRHLGILIIAAHNDGPQSTVVRHLAAAGIHADHVVTRKEVGTAKGSPRWVDHIKHLTGLRTNQLLYVGDSDLDMATAAHAKVVYIHAAWASPNSRYGLLAPSPGWVAAVVEHIFRKQHLWGWTYNYQNVGGQPVRQLALADVNALKQGGVQTDLVEMLKDRQEPLVGQMLLRDFVVLHLTASIYFDGLPETTDVWTVMPSRDGKRTSRMAQSLDRVAKLFRDRYEPNLVVRHTPAQHSKQARDASGVSGAVANQVDTLLVNGTGVPKVTGKTALIFDDFLTMGITSGVGRTLLRMADAADVVTVAIGKFGPRTTLIGRPDGAGWDVTQPAPSGAAARLRLRENELGAFDDAANREFFASYQAMRGARW